MVADASSCSGRDKVCEQIQSGHQHVFSRIRCQRLSYVCSELRVDALSLLGTYVRCHLLQAGSLRQAAQSPKTVAERRVSLT